jgi:uncharacterized C2H2 Zn-finger protein
VRTVHEKRKDHACPHCAAAFGEASGLTTHVRKVHEKRKDHACPHCAAAFGQASDLTTHVRTVHEKRKDHACPHCAAAFGLASSVTKHVSTQHPENTQSNECPVCYEKMTAATAATTSCQHRFCRTCIDASLENGNGLCPVCRQNCTVE